MPELKLTIPNTNLHIIIKTNLFHTEYVTMLMEALEYKIIEPICYLIDSYIDRSILSLAYRTNNIKASYFDFDEQKWIESHNKFNLDLQYTHIRIDRYKILSLCLKSSNSLLNYNRIEEVALLGNDLHMFIKYVCEFSYRKRHISINIKMGNIMEYENNIHTYPAQIWRMFTVGKLLLAGDFYLRYSTHVWSNTDKKWFALDKQRPVNFKKYYKNENMNDLVHISYLLTNYYSDFSELKELDTISYLLFANEIKKIIILDFPTYYYTTFPFNDKPIWAFVTSPYEMGTAQKFMYTI